MKYLLGLKVAAGFVAALLSLGIVGVVSYRNATSLLAHSEWVAHSNHVLDKLKSLQVCVADAETAARGYYLSGEIPNLDPYRIAAEEVPTRVRDLRELIADNPSQQQQLDVLEPLLNAKLGAIQETIQVRQALGPGPFVTNEGKALMDQIRWTIAKMEGQEGVLLVHREAEAKAGGKVSIQIIVLASGLALLLVSWCGFVISREMQSRLCAEKMQRAQADELRRRSIELEAANKDLEAFTYSVSHDLRAPLRHIDGFSKLLLEAAASGISEDARGYLVDIRESTVEMGRLVDDLLNLARIGRKELVLQLTGLGPVVDDAVMAINKANQDRVIEWKIGELPLVDCDPGLIKQVFVNLLSNAAKYTRPRKVARIDVGTTTMDGECVIYVRDNGVGFNMKNASKLFGVFQRLHRQEDFEGTGVGLAIVRRIVQKHNGRVWAEAELGSGATFFFTLGSKHRTEEDNGSSHLVGRG